MTFTLIKLKFVIFIFPRTSVKTSCRLQNNVQIIKDTRLRSSNMMQAGFSEFQTLNVFLHRISPDCIYDEIKGGI